MRYRFSFFMFGAALSTLAAAGSIFASVQGGESSGGVESYQPGTAAWFRQEGREIRTCLNIGQDFGVSREILEAQLTSAFQTWGDYVRDRGVHRHKEYSTELRFLPSCDGSEDLRVVFGAKDDLGDQVRTKFRDPFAFSWRISYDFQQTWGKGLIWIAPNRGNTNWSQPLVLRGALLHEVGHIFGCDHVDGTIMSPRLSMLLIGGGHRSLEYIDSLRMLYTPTAVPMVFNSTSSYLGPSESDARNFQLLTGRAPVGKAILSFTRNPSTQGESGVLNLQDDIESLSYPLSVQNYLDSPSDETPIFRIAGPPVPGDTSIGSASVSRSTIALGNLDLGQGRTLPVAYYLNNMRYPLVIDSLDESRPLRFTGSANPFTFIFP